MLFKTELHWLVIFMLFIFQFEFPAFCFQLKYSKKFCNVYLFIYLFIDSRKQLLETLDCKSLKFLYLELVIVLLWFYEQTLVSNKLVKTKCFYFYQIFKYVNNLNLDFKLDLNYSHLQIFTKDYSVMQ